MKKGFYLSPDGERIIEVCAIAVNPFCQSYDIHFAVGSMAVDGAANYHINILLSCWIYLGE
jgi:hypothetical protein